jgi:hypothetical protein
MNNIAFFDLGTEWDVMMMFVAISGMSPRRSATRTQGSIESKKSHINVLLLSLSLMT